MNTNEGSTVIYNPETRGYFQQAKLPSEPLTAQQMIPYIKPILSKPPEARTNAEVKVLNKFSKKSMFFNAIVQHSSVDVAKNLLKYAQLYQVPKNRTLVTKGAELENIVVLLKGRFGIIDAGNQQKDELDKEESYFYKKMIENSLKIARDLKRKTKQQDSTQPTQFKTSKAAMYDIVVQKFIEDEEAVFNLGALVEGKKYSETVITCKSATILTISARIFYETLASFVRKLKSDKISAFRRFEYFNCIESERLIQLVDELPLITVKKGNFIYKEGEELTSIYLLLKGSIKITKTADLFKQNPNLFYVDRERLNQKRLPFADFSEIYNYKPRTKVLEIGTTNEVSIFGEEELFSEKPIRQVNAQVSSESAVFYVIELAKLEANLPDLKNFMAELKEGLFRNQTEKKFIYRQSKLSELLMCETKNSMDYFFIENGNEGSEHTKLENSPKKYKISKVNQMISPIKNEKPRERSIKQALYHTFNFNKFPLRTSQPPQIQVKNKSHVQFNSAESRVIELVHTMGSRPKSSGEETYGSPRKQSCHTPRRHNSHSKNTAIDIYNPLFQMGYFQKTQKQALRIEKESRLRPLSTSQRTPKLSSSKRMSLSHAF